jgi:FKBP-type peptidyl-prolyl cis-trans isomerase FkpA
MVGEVEAFRSIQLSLTHAVGNRGPLTVRRGRVRDERGGFVVSLIRRSAAVLAVMLAACSGGDRGAGSGESAGSGAVDSSSVGRGEVAIQYAPELGVDLSAMARLPSGLYMRDLQVGDGDTVIAGKRVAVKYTGWLPNGAQFDSNRESPETLPFVVGAGDVIAGWEEGLLGMRPGGRRLLVIPPTLAYGDRGYPGVIPPNSTLVFDVSLVSVMDP